MKLLNSWIKAFEAIEKVKATSSRNAKRDILLASADNPILKRLVGITYSGQKYHITPPNTSKGLKLRKVTALAKRWGRIRSDNKGAVFSCYFGKQSKGTGRNLSKLLLHRRVGAIPTGVETRLVHWCGRDNLQSDMARPIQV
jgi:hypothetical protein